jgi:uncharacterized protein (DUF305 family)
MPKALLASLSIVIFLAGMSLGFALSPEYLQSVSNPSSHSSDLGPADNNLDLRYIDGMIVHHQSAIHLARQAVKQSERPEIVSLAQNIIDIDEADIDKLYDLKRELYDNSRTISQYPQINLGTYDDRFDLRFINAILNHQKTAIDTAREVQTKSIRNQILNIADSVITNLTKAHMDLLALRQQLYQI